MKKYYAAADVFILPSLYEPSSNACLEALASGLAVVTSKKNGVSEIIKDGENGILIGDPTSSEEIAEKIKALLDTGLRERISGNARVLAEKFSIEKNIEETIQMYRKFLEKKH